jgi:hypothetical protein
LQAQRLLREDRALGPLGLGVTVRDGVAAVWGEVPSRDLRERAGTALRQIPGMVDVRNELQIARKREEPLPLVPLHADPPTRRQSASPDPVSGSLGALTGGRGPVPELPPASGPGSPPPDNPVTLLAPRPAAPRPGLAPGRLVHGQPPAPTLAAAVERVRQGDARFRSVTAEVRGKTVVLRGNGENGDHVMMLAQALSGLPGVERVVVASEPSP